MGSFATALYDALLSAGVAADRAREVVDLFDRSVDERYGLHAQVLATKSDIAELRAKVAEDMADLRTHFSKENSETNVRVSKLETRIAETKSDLVKWMLAALTAQTALLLALKLV